jgi:hypothetical protein
MFGSLAGVGIGLLWAFQGCYTAVHAAHYGHGSDSLGSQFAVHWFIFPFIYIYTYLLVKWTV